MTGSSAGVWLLTVAYVAVAALLLHLNLGTRRRGATKVAAIALVTAGLMSLAFMGFNGLANL